MAAVTFDKLAYVDRLKITLAFLALLLMAGCVDPDRGAPGSDRRKAMDTLDRIDTHCVDRWTRQGNPRISCHTHLDGKPPPSVYRSRYRPAYRYTRR